MGEGQTAIGCATQLRQKLGVTFCACFAHVAWFSHDFLPTLTMRNPLILYLHGGMTKAASDGSIGFYLLTRESACDKLALGLRKLT
jgi:hypothetical protein